MASDGKTTETVPSGSCRADGNDDGTDQVRFEASAVNRKIEANNEGAMDDGGPRDVDGSSILPFSGTDIPGGHYLKSTERGESSIERLFLKMKDRRDSRIPVTKDIRKQFLKICRRVSREKGNARHTLHRDDMVELRDKYQESVDGRIETKTYAKCIFQFLGWWDVDVTMLEIFERMIERVDSVDGHLLHYREFNFYDTVVVHKRRFLTNPTALAFIYLIAFYFGTAVFFCGILDDTGVCPSDPDGDKPYYGWVSAIYFASVTMSTVGYGDLSVDDDSTVRLLLGTVYMVLALLVGLTIFTTAADAAFNTFSFGKPISDFFTNVYTKIFHRGDEDDLHLYQIIRRLKFARITKLAVTFLLYNTIGMLIGWIFVHDIKDEGEQWTWMTAFYWAVQTTTTIGYGDLTMPFNLRWFQIFFTTFGTVLVGSVFGELSNLRSELQDTRRFYAWNRRKVSKRLIEDMKGSERSGCDSDARIDQYEFMVGSLLTLNKVQQTDVQQIMDKFRELAGDKGYIEYTEALQEDVATASSKLETESQQDDLENLDVDVDIPPETGIF